MARPRTAQAVEPRRPGVGDASKRPIGRRSARTGAPATDHAPRRGISGRRHPHGPGDAPQWEHSAPSPCQEAELPVGCPERGPSGHWAAQTPASGPLDTRFRRTLQPSPSHVGAAHGPAWINAAHAGGTSYMYPLLAQGGMPSADGMRRWAIPQHALSHPLTPAAPAGRAVGPVPKFHLASGVLSSGGASGPGAPPGAQNGGRTRRATTAPGSRTSAAAAAAPATTTSQQSSPLHLSAAARTKAETRLRKLAPPPLALAPLAARGASADGGDGDGGGSFMYPPSRPSPGDSSSEDGRALAAFASGHPDGRLTPDWAPYGPATRPSGGFTPLLPPHYHSAHAIVPPGFPGASWMHPGWPPTPAAVDPRAFMWSPYYGMPTQWVANSAGSADLNAPWNVDAQGQGQGSMGHASSVDPAPQGLSAAAAAVAGASTAAAAAAAAATDAMAGTGHGSGTLPPYPRSSDADHLAAAVAIAGMSRGAPAAGGGQGSPARGRMQAASSSAPSKVRPGKSDGQPSHQPRGAAAATLRAQKRTRMRIPAAMARQRLNERVAAASALKRKRPPQSSDEGGGKRRRSSRSRVLSPLEVLFALYDSGDAGKLTKQQLQAMFSVHGPGRRPGATLESESYKEVVHRLFPTPDKLMDASEFATNFQICNRCTAHRLQRNRLAKVGADEFAAGAGPAGADEELASTVVVRTLPTSYVCERVRACEHFQWTWCAGYDATRNPKCLGSNRHDRCPKYLANCTLWKHRKPPKADAADAGAE